jgi:hypothetical protein
MRHAPVLPHTLASTIVAPHTCSRVLSCMARLPSQEAKPSALGGEGRGGRVVGGG